MQIVHADNGGTESQIEFVVVERGKYASPEEFYDAAIRLLWEGSDSEENTKNYIAGANSRDRSVEELQRAVLGCLQITPVVGFTPNLADIERVISFRDEWNNREFVWYSESHFWLLSWGTAA